jgi:hypothetical protein
VSWVEPVAGLLLASYVLLRLRLSTQYRQLLGRLGLLAIASWVGEESAIRAYGFYHYATCWRVLIGHVPLGVVLIWPAVIHSAWDTSRCLLGRPLADADGATATSTGSAQRRRERLVPLAGAALVFADAWLIEPLSVQAGLWSWSEPGLFGVPPVGVVGWAVHAGLCMAVLEQSARARLGSPGEAAMIVLAPLGMHALLLGCWWGALRWLSGELSPWPAVAAAWLASLGLTWWAVRSGARRRVPPAAMWARVPPTLFFLALLGLRARDAPALWAWAFAFAPPYLTLTRWPTRS